MNYEQKYKEALEWMRSIYPTMQGADKEDAEHHFPELRESEDERMMNNLHSWMKEFGGAEEYTEKVHQWIKGLLEKQGEQKPVEWSEEDDRILYNVIAYIGFAAGQRGVRDDAFKEANHWLKSLKDRVQLQTKRKCDEEDEKKIMWLVRLISTAGFRELDNDKMPCSRSELLDWLKSLKDRVQPQSKQEWSEEDEKRLQDVIYWFEIFCDKNKTKPEMKESLDWLKSIKPKNHWKPSEEQMEALKNRTHGLHTSSETRKILESLINDLEKL